MMEQSKIHRWFKISRLSTAIIVTSLFFLLSHIPQQKVPEDLRIGGWDKVMHVIAYGCITGLFLYAIKSPINWKTLLIIFLSFALFGFIDEYTQSFVGRSCSFYDWLADILGSAAAMGIWGTIRTGRTIQNIQIETS